MRTSKTAAKGLAVLLCAVLSLWAIPAQVLADEPSSDQADNPPAASRQAQYPLRAGLAPGEGASLLPSNTSSTAVAEYNGKPYATLQEAIDAATEGGKVSLVAHTEEGDLTFPADGIEVDLAGYTLTIPDGKEGFIVVNRVTNKDGISNITIHNGSITGSKTSYWVRASYAKSLTLKDLTLSDMQVIDGHDGIYISRSETVMENCRIENSTGAISSNAGAMVAVESGTLTMSSCTVENCEAGGPIIEAGVNAWAKTPPTLTMNDCRISYNTGSYCGGLLCQGAQSGSPWWAMIALNDTVITGNRARNETYSGGGLNMYRTQLRMNGGAIYGNFVPDNASQDNSGADVYVYKGYTNMVFPKASDMSDGGADLGGYFWVDKISNISYEEGIDMGRNVNLVNPMGLKVDRTPLNVARNMRTNVEYLTLAEAVAAAQAGDTLQLCAADNGGGAAVTENTNIAISKNLTIDLNGHHLNGLNAAGKVFTVAGGSKLNLIGGRTNDNGSLVANEIDGAIENSGELEVAGAITFKDKIFHRGQRLFITGSHGNLRIALAKGKYIEADADLTADSIRVYLLDAAERAALNDRNHDHEDVLICKGGTAALESVTSTPEIDNPHVRRIHKADGPQGEGLYLVDKIPTGIYLDGANGDDGAAGTEGAPVKTFAKAKELLEKQIAGMSTASLGTQAENTYPDGIYIMNTVTVDGTESWSMPEHTDMIRHENLRGALVHVTGDLTLTDMAIDGHSEGGVTANSALIDVNGGTLTLGEGAVVRNNTNTTTATIGSTGNAAGGVLARNGAQVLLKGGAITGNEAALGGGVGLYGGSMLTMSDGTIANNRALRKYHLGETRPAGGGVFVAGSSKMNFSGGVISENRSEFYGGGISLGGYTFATISFDKTMKGSLNMTGGVIDRNTASANGGGIFVQANTVATISAGSITNNEARAAENALFAGGGIYVNSNGKVSDLDYGSLQMTNVLITDNQARVGGGGIGACPTSLTLIFVSSGAAIYENDAPVAHDVLIDATTGTNVYGLNPEHVAYISHYMLGGGEARWQRDGTDLYTEPDTIDQLSGHTHMTTHRSLELKAAPTDEDIQKALAVATVRISGNYSATRGGGLASNGNVRIGTRWDISAQKKWNDGDDADGIRPESVKVRLKAMVVYQGETIEIPHDVLPFQTDVTLDESNGWRHTWHDLPEVIPEDDPSVAQYKNLEITYKIDEIDVPEGYTCTIDGNMFEGYTITNTHEPVKKGGFKVSKAVSGDAADPSQEFRFQVRFYRPDGSELTEGEFAYTGSRKGTIASGGEFSLKGGESIILEGLPEGTRWSVRETAADAHGYEIEPVRGELRGREAEEGTIAADEYPLLAYTNEKNSTMGALSIQKTVEGEGADKSREFEFKVTIGDDPATPVDESKAAEFAYTGSRSGIVANGDTIKLKHGEKVTIEGLPAGTPFKVEEAAADGYESKSEGADGKIEAGKTSSASFVNTHKPAIEEPSKPTPTKPTPSSKSAVTQSGDSMGTAIALIAALVVGSGALVFAGARRRNRR